MSLQTIVRLDVAAIATDGSGGEIRSDWPLPQRGVS
jgi:hypothetical protein